MTNFSFKNYYTWSGNNPKGHKKTGEVAALTLGAAKKDLLRKGIKPITLFKKKKNWQLFQKKIMNRDIVLLFRQLATLITSGIPIVQCFEILRQSEEKIPLRLIINAIKNEIETGKNLTHSLRKFPQFFDNLTCHLINLGEKTGSLDRMLQRVAQNKENQQQLKNKIIHALTYPTIIFSVAFIVTFIMLIFVIPRFETLFQTMHGALPFFTRSVFAFSQFVRNNIFLYLFLIASLVIMGCVLKFIPRLRQLFDHYILKLPWIGMLIKKVLLIQLSRSLAVTYGTGMPIIEALAISTHMSTNHEYVNTLQKIQARLVAGQQLHIALQPYSLFPPMTIQLIKVGEESGALETMLEKIADLYESDLNHLIVHLEQILEPLIIIILGVLIGGMVIAMYLPIFKLGTLI